MGRPAVNDWSAWVGREEQRSDVISEGLAARWLATMDRTAPDGDLMPQAIHWSLCLPDAPTNALGSDGHPMRDESPESLLPPVTLPRRMWASSKVEFHIPFRIGDAAARVSKIVAIKEKSGGTGQLLFVDVLHETFTGRGLAVREVQTLVYRDAPPPGAPPTPPEPGSGAFEASGWDAVRTVTPSEALLFRYSALTFNSHRIHYDLPYAQQQEGYRGLVVHGPLTATLLLDLAQRELGDNRLERFAFRGLSPAICGDMLHLALRAGAGGWELGAFASDGRQVMSASAA